MKDTGSVFVSVSADGERRLENPRMFQPVEVPVWADPAPDFSRVLGLVRVAGSRASDDLTIVLNWRTELGRK